MRKIPLSMLLAAAVFATGCYTKAYVRETLKFQEAQQAQQAREAQQQAQSVQNNTNQVASQSTK